MEASLKAKEIVNSFYQPLGRLSCNVSNNAMWEHAKKNAIFLVNALLNRDKLWIEKLSKEHPDHWQISDFEKSKAMYNLLVLEIDKL